MAVLSAGALTVLVGVTLLAISATSAQPTDMKSGDAYVDVATLEGKIETQMAYMSAMTWVYDVSCPMQVESIAGNHFSCSVVGNNRFGTGQSQYYVDVTIKNGAGDFSWKVP